MPLTCPACGGKRPRTSAARGIREELLRVLGIYSVRCEDCGHRYSDSLWRFADILYAKCPKCYRTDLSTWQLRYYRPPFMTMLKMHLGGRRMRCEACRQNFVSFRLMKERSTFRKPSRAQATLELAKQLGLRQAQVPTEPASTDTDKESSSDIQVA